MSLICNQLDFEMLHCNAGYHRVGFGAAAGKGASFMSLYFATHAGLLRYVSREFAQMADADSAEGRKLALYAAILDRMIEDLVPEAEAQAGAAAHAPVKLRDRETVAG